MIWPMEPSADGSPRLPRHFPTLDGIRGLAIVLVVSHQLNRLVGNDLLTRLADHVLVGGWAGVQLFFVLSGFLISGILLDSRESPDYFRNFYIRRALRIFPIYYFALLLFIVALPALGIVPLAWHENQLPLWLYYSNWPPYAGGTALLPHFWSLAVEEQFYLVWPLLVHSRSPRALLRLCAVLAVASLLARVAMVAAGIGSEAIYMNSFSRLDALVAGSAVAAMLRVPGWLPRMMALMRPRSLLPLCILGAVVFEMAFGYKSHQPSGQTIGYTLLSVMFALLILAAACSDAAGGRPGTWARLLQSAMLRSVAKYSYGMYIFHKPMSDLLGDPLLKSLGYSEGLSLPEQVMYLMVGDGCVFVVGMLSYWMVERHFLRLRPRFGRAPNAQRGSS